MNTRRPLLAGALAFVLLTPGCAAFYRGPRGVEDALEDQLGVNLDREFGFKLGWTSTKLVGSFAWTGDDEDTLQDIALASAAGTVCENCHQTNRTYRGVPSCADGGGSHPGDQGCHFNASLLNPVFANPRY